MLSTLTSKGQVTIAQALRQRLGLVPGQAVEFDLSADATCITMRPTPSVRELPQQGSDFADALHHASGRHCDAMATFDDKGFVQRAAAKGWVPKVMVP